mmetsp:Transcript_5598/g.12761  ORF Transcript_5598/g.12761 Transcript_5598/m.12761 type:complete len:230 (+) Transcript_5598:6-695(+)
MINRECIDAGEDERSPARTNWFGLGPLHRLCWLKLDNPHGPTVRANHEPGTSLGEYPLPLGSRDSLKTTGRRLPMCTLAILGQISTNLGELTHGAVSWHSTVWLLLRVLRVLLLILRVLLLLWVLLLLRVLLLLLLLLLWVLLRLTSRRRKGGGATEGVQRGTRRGCRRRRRCATRSFHGSQMSRAHVRRAAAASVKCSRGGLERWALIPCRRSCWGRRNWSWGAAWHE